MAKGNGALRLDVMHNDFLLIGPASDPAKAKGDKAACALRKIAETASPFASRGDKSGTHKKEQELWKAAGMDPMGKPWLLSTGQGMGETARVASEKGAYTLIDRGTWLALKSTLKLESISEGEPSLANPYGVIVVNAARFPRVQEKAARDFAHWLVSPEAQNRIAAFGKDKYGQPLFVPDARKEPAP
jgi:tungstate transport system substrate-binding protein